MFQLPRKLTPFAPSLALSSGATTSAAAAASPMWSSISALGRAGRKGLRGPRNFRARQFSEGPQVESEPRLVYVGHPIDRVLLTTMTMKHYETMDLHGSTLR